MTMINRVYGVIGVKSIMANWNADFTGRPKMTSKGDIFGSDKALKYPHKAMWVNTDEKVLYFKTYKTNEKDGTIQPKDLEERYEELFGDTLTSKTTSEEVLKNLFTAIDVLNFGATFAVKGHNIAITGVVQFGQGFNKYEDTYVETHDILSPFRNSTKDDAGASSLGKKIFVDEAHYFYPFSINPENIQNYVKLIPEFKGYTKEVYEKFKETSLVAVTSYNTNSKFGCENEFALFVECKEDAQLYLPDLAQYIVFEKGEEKDLIDLSKLSFLNNISTKQYIDKIEIYYNPYTTEIKDNFEATSYNIFTKERV